MPDPDAEIREIIASPMTPQWVKVVALRLLTDEPPLDSAIDPVDASNGLEYLADAFHRRTTALFEAHTEENQQ